MHGKYYIIEDYIERVYSFAKHHTYNIDEAEELSQEIYLQLCKCINTVKSDTSVEAWIWSVSRNTLCAYRRKKGKERNNVFYYGESDVLFHIEDDYEDTVYKDEQFNNLRNKLIQLSSEYRNILVMHYFDKMSVRDIADKLNIAEGTIKWRLSEGREKIKREWNNMTDTMIKPKNIRVSITGNGNYGNGIIYPGDYLKDALAQNILWHTRKDGKTVEELSTYTGLPAYYIEDRIADMLYREALVKVGNKYKADFVIYDKELMDKLNDKGYELAERIYEPVVNAIKSIDGDFWRNGIIVMSSMDELNPENLDKDYFDKKYARIRYDGYNWLYHGYTDNTNLYQLWWTAKGTEYINYIAVSYCTRENGYIHKVPDCIPAEYINKLRDVHHNRLMETDLTDTDKNIVLKLIEKGIYKKDDNEITINVPYYTIDEYRAIVESGRKALINIKDGFRECLKERNEYYYKLIGKEYRNDIIEFAPRDFYTLCVDLAMEHGVINLPTEKTCDFIVQYK